MASNLKALIERSTPLSAERAKALIAADMAANSHRYSPPLRTSEAMESEYPLDERLHGPPVPETVISAVVKSALAIDEEHRRLMTLDDAVNGLNDVLSGRVLPEEEFRKSARRLGPQT